jgi:hypothetical protein
MYAAYSKTLHFAHTLYVYVLHVIVSTEAIIYVNSTQQICLCNGVFFFCDLGTDYLYNFSLH